MRTHRGALAAALATVLSGCHNGERPMTTLSPKSDLAQWAYDLFIQVTLWDALIFAIVLTAFVLAVFVYSTRVGEAGPPSSVASDLGLEVAWTVGPALVLLMISVPTVRTIFRSQPLVPPENALVIRVIAHQWWWEFSYDEYGFVTANEIHLPVDRPIRLEIASADVIHSFWVPQLGGKRDAVPGQVNELTFIAHVPGVYPGQCAEFCGLSHANMRMVAFVQTPDEFAAWTDRQREAPPAPAPPEAPAVASGARIFANSPCTTCHAVKGVSTARLGPDLTHFGSRATLAAGIRRNTPEELAEWLKEPDKMKPGALMPPLGLRGRELDELVAYLQSLK
jgi:cytochrome c oxidase subunit 2